VTSDSNLFNPLQPKQLEYVTEPFAVTNPVAFSNGVVLVSFYELTINLF